MNSIKTNWGKFDTNLKMSKCLSHVYIQNEKSLLDKIFDGNLFFEKLLGIKKPKSNNEDLLQAFYDWQEKKYDELQDYYQEHLKEMGYGCTEDVTDGYENFCLDYYKEEVPAYKLPLLVNDRC